MPLEPLSSLDKATEWYYQQRDAFLELGQFYEERNYIPQALKSYLDGAIKKNIPARAALERFANNDNNIAQYYLGIVLENDQAWAQALTQYTSSANKQYAPAIYRIGRLYEEGRIPKEENLEELKWYYKAALAGSSAAVQVLIEQSYSNAKATHYLKQIYKPDKILELYIKAHEAGNPQASMRAAQLYATTQANTPENNKKIWDFYLHASKKGLPDALIALERLAEQGSQKMQQELAQVHRTLSSKQASASTQPVYMAAQHLVSSAPILKTNESSQLNELLKHLNMQGLK